MKVKLRTLCGCEKEVDIPFSHQGEWQETLLDVWTSRSQREAGVEVRAPRKRRFAAYGQVYDERWGSVPMFLEVMES